MFKEPMKGSAADETLTFPKMASPKLDGIRAVNVDGKLYTRSMKLIPNPHVQRTFGVKRFHGLDGELMVGGSFHETQAVMRKRDEAIEVTWWVFDKWDARGGFQQRFADVVKVSHPSVRVVPHRMVQSQEELDAFERECLASGFEGVMLRDPSGPYVQGRATARQGYLLKVKRFEDSEAVVTGFVEEMHNANPKKRNEVGRLKRSSAKAGKSGKGTLGVLLGRDVKTGKEIRVGTGISRALKARIWRSRKSYVGRPFTYTFQPHGTKNRPRIPVFKGFRED